MHELGQGYVSAEITQYPGCGPPAQLAEMVSLWDRVGGED